MSTKELYSRFSRLCQRWPKDETKAGRDFGEVFREKLNKHFPHGDLGKVSDPSEVVKVIEPLERIAENKYFNENPLKRSSSTGLETGTLRYAISNEGLKLIHDQDEATLFKRLKSRLGIKLSGSKFEGKSEKD